MWTWRRSLTGNVSSTATILSYLFQDQLRQQPRYSDPRRLVAHGYKVYSMHDQDGNLHEIFNRIGTTDRYFVEFGASDGLESNTLYMLLKGWSGSWIDGSQKSVAVAATKFVFLINDGKLQLRHAYLTAETIGSVFAQLGVPAEFDLLSMDVDGNEYWLWKALGQYRPRVVVVEYNASLGKHVRCTVEYRPDWLWDGSNYFNSSLGALEHLGREKGYSLVGCNLVGTDAFFVRNDLVGDHFLEPFTAEHHYEPPRYYLRMPNGHPAGFGPYVNVAE
jgi:hypothetical protein